MSSFLKEVRPTLALAVPIIAGQVSQMLMGITDSAMIGHTGTVPLAASSFGGNVFQLFYIVGIGLMIPVAIFVSRSRGAGKAEECAEYLRHGVWLAVIVGTAFTLILAALAPLLDRFGQPPEVVAIVTPFYLWIGGSITSVLIYLAVRQFAEAIGHPWIPMLVMLAGVGLNALLNWVLIYGHLGLPALGLTGAGISTFVSRALGAWVIFNWLRRHPGVQAAWPKRWLAPLSKARLREMLGFGVPAAGSMLFETGAFVASALMIGWLGPVPLAAHQIALTCAGTTFMFLLGFSMAAGMRISAARGAGETTRLRPIGFTALGLGSLCAATFMLVYLVGGHQIASWFVRDGEVVALAAKLLVVAAFFQLVDGGQVIGAASLRGLGDVKLPMLITFIAYWVIAIPLGYFFGVRGTSGAVGMWSALATGLAFAAVFLAWRFVRLTRRL